MGCLAGLSAALRAKVLVATIFFALELCPCHSSRSCHRDALVLFQVAQQYRHHGLRQESQRPSSRAAALFQRRHRRERGLPLVDGKLHFVASVEFAVDFLGHVIKCQKLAMYLDQSCPVWVNLTSDEYYLSNRDLALMLGNVRITMLFQNIVFRILPRNRILNKVQTLLAEELKAEFGDSTDHTEELDDFFRMLTQSPPLHMGSHLSFMPSAAGVTVEQDGERLGTTDSIYLGPAFIEAFLGERAYTTTFRGKVFDQLRTGYPTTTQDSAQVILHSPWWVILIFFLVCAALACIIIAWIRCCCLLCSSR